MIVNHINTDPMTTAQQKAFLLKGWNLFKSKMTAEQKAEYQVRLQTIKHLENKVCPLEDKKYFASQIFVADVEATLF